MLLAAGDIEILPARSGELARFPLQDAGRDPTLDLFGL